MIFIGQSALWGLLWCMSLIFKQRKQWQIIIPKANKWSFYVHRYLEVCGEQVEEEAQKKLEPTALSCYLNTAACKLKMQLWQEALDSCNEVTWAGTKQTVAHITDSAECSCVAVRVYRWWTFQALHAKLMSSYLRYQSVPSFCCWR